MADRDPRDLRADVDAWLADDVDPDDAAELRAVVDCGDADELADRFRGPLAFGTAGLRGPLRAGPNGMNTTVVRRTAAGLAAHLASDAAGGRIALGFDARHRSAAFARDSAAVFAAAGFSPLLLPRALPTPVLAFAVRRLGAVAGVMVTASHNPPQDNGYKVYGADGAQIVPPTDSRIEAAIRAVGPTRDIPLSDDVRVLDESVVDDYVAAVAALAAGGPRDVRLVHTALHGVGTPVVRAVLEAAGFPAPVLVAAQAEPDPDFPTVAFPNPEEPGALDLALATADEHGADLVLANDPDADRCAVAVPGADGWRVLRGDEVGVLLADALIRRGVHGTYATTIVSSTLLGRLAARRGVGYAETLTGFKWIVRAADDLVYGYEEALGYAVAPTLVRDKDGISAALLVAEAAAALKAAGSSLLARLDDLYSELGVHATDQVSVRVDDLSEIGAMMGRLRRMPPLTFLDDAVTVTDRLPDADVLTLSFDSGRVVVRPSGTEPKLKAYLEVVSDDHATAAAELRRLRTEVTAALG